MNMFKLNSLNSLRALRHLHHSQSAGVRALTTCSSLILKQSNPLLSPPSSSPFAPSHNLSPFGTTEAVAISETMRLRLRRILAFGLCLRRRPL
ncbi:stomatin-like protein 2 mitochondrial [Prunus yedoensis var. nudiflora]|uniref:Stomatin-like protein 2 mitochondrial n=1 Tax=Prunus yedoensis var. nudiflora TaxID=2094558 RepID=A0A314UV44_PRUYE|nr:stomatin-like protein 2 mitochondrial [Prunus yedoensis var. nudiflora]